MTPDTCVLRGTIRIRTLDERQRRELDISAQLGGRDVLGWALAKIGSGQESKGWSHFNFEVRQQGQQKGADEGLPECWPLPRQIHSLLPSV